MPVPRTSKQCLMSASERLKVLTNEEMIKTNRQHAQHPSLQATILRSSNCES
jgi:hypothetical protein